MTEGQLLAEAQQKLAQLTQRPVTSVRRPGHDFVWRSGPYTFLVEAKASPSLAHVAQAVHQLADASRRRSKAIPLLVVPSIGPGMRRLAADANISWIDAAGRADIRGPGLRLLITEPSSSAPKASRRAPFGRTASNVVHALLLAPHTERDATALARSALVDNGYVTRILNALIDDGFVTERRVGRRRLVKVVDPQSLLTAWDEAYKRPEPFAYALLAAPDGFHARLRVATSLRTHGVRYAMTGLAAAAEYTRFGSFRRVTVYVPRSARSAKLDWAFEDDARGRNVAFVDEADVARIGSRELSGTTFASPILTYLDLRFDSERAEEARVELRRVIEKSWT
jgi:hypothetical protein